MSTIKIWGDIDEYENNKICFINPSQVISISASEYGVHVTKNEEDKFVLEKGDISILLSNGVIIKPHIILNEYNKYFGLDVSEYPKWGVDVYPENVEAIILYVAQAINV